MNSLRLKKYASLTILLSAAATSSAADPLTVALSGTLAPDGSTYTAFANPVLNANGQVAFNAGLSGGISNSGIFTGLPGAILPVALQGTAAPNGELYGTLYTSPTTPIVSLNSGGVLAFTSPLTGGTPTSGIFTGTSAATLQAIALQSTAAPAGGNYNAFLAQGTNVAYAPVLNPSGQVAIQSTLTGGSSAAGIFLGSSAATLQTVALVGGTAPAGTPAPGTYATTVTVPTLNANGQVAFVSLVGSTAKQAIFAGAPRSIQTVMIQSSTAPGTGGELYGTPTTSYSYNDAGQAAFITSLTGGASTSGIFVGAPGSVQPVVLNNTTPAGIPGTTFGTLSNVTVNGSGRVAFTGNLNVTAGGTSSALFVGTPSSLTVVAQAGTPAPDGESYASFGSAELQNNAGQVAFIANLNGADVVAGTNSVALFGGTPTNLTEIVRQGQVIDVDPGPLVDNRTVSGIGSIVSGGGQDGKGIDLNDGGEIAFRLTFVDGSSGVFVSAVPEPTTLGLFAAGAGLLLHRKRRTSVEGH